MLKIIFQKILMTSRSQKLYSKTIFLVATIIRKLKQAPIILILAISGA